MAFWPFERDVAEAQAKRLLDAVIAASRQPSLFGENRVADTLEGRIELMTLHAALAMVRLRAAPDAKRLAQLFADRLFRHFDSGLREAGVGDLTVPKRMRRLAGEFYGRLEAYSGALASGDRRALESALARNLLAGAPGADAAGLAEYAAGLSGRLAAAPIDAMTTRHAWAPL